MTRLFDTRSLMALCLDSDAPEISTVFDEHVLDLTFYEAGDAIWKAYTRQDRITAKEHEQLTALVSDLRREVLVHTLADIGFETVMALASETGLTFYDAAHLACAIELDGTLVTEDESSREIAEGHVEVRRVSTLQ